MLKEVIDRILELGPIRTLEDDDEMYVKQTDHLARLKRPHEEEPNPLQFTTLTGFADYVLRNPDELPIDKFIIHVEDYDVVSLLGPLQPTNENERFCYAKAKSNIKQFQFGVYMAIEPFVVGLQTMFAECPEESECDLKTILSYVGNVASERVAEHADDGFSQSIQIRTGLSMKSAVKVQNPVVVRPHRTFGEVEPPETVAVLRFKEDKREESAPQVGLFEGAGERWRIQAIKDIADWLRHEFPPMIVLA